MIAVVTICCVQNKNSNEREELVLNQTKQYEEIRLKLESLGDGLYPKPAIKQIRQPNDELPTIRTEYGRENKYVDSYDRVRMRADSHNDLLHQRLFEPDDRVYSSLDNLTDSFDASLIRTQSSPELDKVQPPAKPKKPPKKPLRKSKVKRNEKATGNLD